jgi:DNA-directed RNA polymerase subunit RPC12/RpoP
MKKLLYILALSSLLFANNADTASCKKCHPTIVSEFQSSMHKKSSIHDDKIHKAVWDKHPAKAKGKYKCAKCHTPNSTKSTEHEGITCLSCHTIMDVQKHEKANKNIYSGKKKAFYSAEAGRESEKVVYKTTTSWWGNKTTIGSAYHDLDYTNNIYYTGEICMGCHSHKQNSHSFNVCVTEDAGAKDKKSNCITCHMPKVEGTATTVRISKKHTFHGFAGARVESRMLSKYVDINFAKNSNGFDITINNNAPHALLTHPLRVVQLKTTITRNSKAIALKTHTFVKLIGTKGKPSMPWVATEVVKDTMIKANEKRVIKYEDALQSGDKVEVTLGFYVVNPKALKKLNLDGDKEISKFTILKTKNFNIE